MTKKLKDYRKLVYSLRFGIELESEFPEKVDIMLLRERYQKLLNSWTVVTDHSMNNGLEFKPTDKNKLYFDKESFAEISEVLHIIRKHKGQVDGKKCGLHIHIDAQKFKDEEILKIVKEMMAKQKFLIRDFKVSKERLAQYCKPITKASIKGLNIDSLNAYRAGKPTSVDLLSDKYYLLNVSAYSEHKTIEFRLFNGTKTLREIKRILKYIYEFLVNALERE